MYPYRVFNKTNLSTKKKKTMIYCYKRKLKSVSQLIKVSHRYTHKYLVLIITRQKSGESVEKLSSIIYSKDVYTVSIIVRAFIVVRFQLLWTCPFGIPQLASCGSRV